MKKSKLGNANMNSSDSCIILGTRKRNKKVVFDPSDNNLPKRKRNSIAKTNLPKITPTKQKKKSIDCRTYEIDDEHEDNSSMGGVCSVCRHQKNDRFISCQDCCNKAHLGCLDSDIGILRLRPDNSWQCPHCKTCVVCEETADSGELTVCKICSDAYHSLCHNPKIKEKSITSPKWTCSNCEATSSEFENMSDGAILKVEDMDTMEITHIEDTISNDSNMVDENPPNKESLMISDSEVEEIDASDEAIITNEDQSNHNLEEKDTNEMEFSEEFGYEIDPRVPDATNWTSDDVYKYFQRYFPKEAAIFKTEEIDGLSLLLMTRDNVVQDLQLKLGVAIKMYRHIAILQERRDNPRRYF